MWKVFLRSDELAAPARQRADFIELFFDLVFVYAITRITAMTAHHLDADHVLRSVLLFWLIWWGWTQFTWALNAANTKIAEVRLMVLIATGVAFVMASSVNQAFEAGVLWFAVPYVVIRVIGLGLYIRVTTNLDGHRAAVLSFATASTGGLLAVLAGAAAEPSHRMIWWLAAIGLDMLAGLVGGRGEGWNLRAAHFAERHSLLVIIALGESLIVAAQAVSSHERTNDFLMVGALAVLVTCLLWWTYFSWLSEFLEEHLAKVRKGAQARLARDAYSFLHFPLVCGIIGIAAGFEIILSHPNDLLSVPVAASLGGGYVLFIVCSAASVWRAGKVVLMTRILIPALSIFGIVFSVGHSPRLVLVVIAVSLALIAFIEWKRCRTAHGTPRATVAD